MTATDAHIDPILIVLYRWRLRPGHEELFIEAWSRISELLRSQHGSMGSRLHRGSDGIWYSYAQWPNAKSRVDAFSLGHVDSEAAEQMAQAAIERLPEITLKCVADFLLPIVKNDT
jgi:heme-degrading monooxygenase HmoA